MKWPRCSLFDIPDGAPACAVCGYQLPGATAEPASPPGSPSSPAPPDPGLTELDARRELAREFRIEALLPAGDETTTAVYLAYDPRQDRQVEVKVAPRQPLRDAGAEDRFRRAAEAAAALDHPHILPIYRCGATASFLWFSTKHVEGRSVAELVRTNGPMDLTHCLRILEQVASALDYAHRRGVSAHTAGRGRRSPGGLGAGGPEPHRGGRRLAGAAGLVLVLGGGGVCLPLSSPPPAPPIDRRMGRPSPPATLPAPPPPPAP